MKQKEFIEEIIEDLRKCSSDAEIIYFFESFKNTIIMNTLNVEAFAEMITEKRKKEENEK